MTEVLKDPQPNETRFDPTYIPNSQAARELVSEVAGQLLKYEATFHPRRRRRRKTDQERFERIVTAIVCDLVHLAFVDPEAWRYISLSKRRSSQEAFGVPFMTEARITIIDWMSQPEMGWLQLKKAEQATDLLEPRQSTIRAAPRLMQLADEYEVFFSDIRHDLTLPTDLIVLRGIKIRGKAKTLAVPPGDPAETYRAEMHCINSFLMTAEIDCDVEDSRGRPWDVTERLLRRIFNDARMDRGGRLYGGFWQRMSAKSRQEDVWINGEAVASLDFGQCGVRIAYSLVDAKPPPGDLYEIPGLEHFRRGVKSLLSSQLSKIESMSRKPGGTSKDLPRDMSIDEIERTILAHHEPLRKIIYKGIAPEIQFIESQILVKSLLRLVDEKVIGLPVHDSLLVPRSSASTARQVMLDSFESVTGVEGVIT